MSFPPRTVSPALVVPTLLALLAMPGGLHAQRDARPPAATQGFDSAECRNDCVMDTLVVDVDRGRRAQPGVVTATLLLVDTVALPRRNAPPAPRERAVPVYVTCDDQPCAAAMVTGRISDKRLDDARVVRRTQLAWPLPAPLLQRLSRTSAMAMSVDGRSHGISAGTLTATRALVESVKSAIAAGSYSPRAQLYVATFAAFGLPGDSTLSEDVGTATEPLMIPDANTAQPTRVATLTFVGRGAEALPLLVQDDATGAAPIFGVNEKVTVLLPARTGRRGVVSATVVARQRVESMRDACQGMKLWTYLVTMSPADLQLAQRGMIASPRPGEGVERWNGAAVREPVSARVTPVEQRAITASRTVVAQFVRERAATGVLARDVQVLAALPRNSGFVTNFGAFVRDGNGGWRFPTLTLRPATCP
ncbi:MAG: hypothetical protein V4813_03390 [Gemmatimonadota bacterium]